MPIFRSLRGRVPPTQKEDFMTESVEPSHPLARPSGARRLSLAMLIARDSADTFTGLPRGSVKPMRILAAFQEAEPYLGLPAHSFKLVSWLAQKTQPQDWEEGNRPIAWPSAREVEEFLSISPTRRKALERALFDAGIIVMRDDPQGKRYGRRDKTTGRIIVAFGYDLSPLAQRQEEFIRIAATAKVERDRMKALRRRVTLARRSIRQAGETLATLDRLPASWPKIESDTASLVRAARNAEISEELALIVASLERRKNEAEQVLRDLAEPVNKTPEGPENGPLNTTTNLTVNLKDTVIASEASSRAGSPSSNPNPSVSAATPDLGFRLRPSQLVELVPQLSRYLETTNPGWAEIVAAADWLRADLGISASLWGEACVTMGREYAATAIAVVSAKEPGYLKAPAVISRGW
jgi:replication initiation protein RepC